MSSLIDLTGATYGRWTVVRRAGRKRGFAAWLCRCACGQYKEIRSDSLKRGDSSSCGCLSVERSTTHGQTSGGVSPEYRSWSAAKNRCVNPNNGAWRDYGGRGIKICERWLVFENFLADMGRRPPGLTLDRIDNDGNYEPGNCRWATRKQQAQNRRAARNHA